MSTTLEEDANQTIPSSILQTVRQQLPGNLGSPKKPGPNVKLPPLSMLTTQGNVTSASMWHHSGQRQKLKHLMDKPQCVCGAGTRDISFLYDSDEAQNNTKDVAIPPSLLPEEFHVVKSTGVLGLLLHDDPYSVTLDNHEKHLTAFPSLKPSGRQEVLALKNSLQQMIQRAGIGNKLLDSDLSGPTQMHNLITLVKKEQEIYNICFHELIRQVSVGCVERGALLAEIRDCYANLLSRIPFQVKSLHDEVLAQRALDRKLTVELGRFKSLMSSLTSELSELKDQNELVGEEIHETRNGLSVAISESEKNANLLTEYCELYELQRRRLEDHIVLLTQEKDLWEQTSYQLALKVAKKKQLKTVQRIQLSGKSWEKLGIHFTILMADKDTKELSVIQDEVLKWRKQLTSLSQSLWKIEEELKAEVSSVEQSMHEWLGKLINQSNPPSVQKENDSAPTTPSTPRSTVLCFGKQFIKDLWEAVSGWVKVLNNISEMFSGEVLLDRQEQLIEIEQSMKNWSNRSMSIVQHHVVNHFANISPMIEQQEHHSSMMNDSNNSTSSGDGGDGGTGDQEEEEDGCGHSSVAVHSVEGVSSLVGELALFVKDLAMRTSGENGVAVAFVHLVTPLETWESKLNLMLTKEMKYMIDSDIKKLISQITDWLKTLRNISEIITKASERNFISDTLSRKVDKWCSLFSRSIQVEDGQAIQQVTKVHSSLVKWMSKILLYLTSEDQGDSDTPPVANTPPTADTPSTEGSSSGTDVNATTEPQINISELKSSCTLLCDHLHQFTKEIVMNCSLIFEEIINESVSSQVTLETEEEKEELQILSKEAANWIRLASVLVDKCMDEHRKRTEEAEEKGSKEEGETADKRDGVLQEAESGEFEVEGEETSTGDSDGDEKEENSEMSDSKKEELLRTVMTIDVDDNVSEISNTYRKVNQSPMLSSVPLKKLGLTSEEELPEGRGALLKDAEKLLIELNETKAKLAEQESLTRTERKRAESAELRVKQTKDDISRLTATLEQTQTELRELQKSADSKSRKTNKTPKSREKRKQ